MMNPSTALVRGRVAVSVLFLLYGTILGAWTARIPAVKYRLELSDARLSIGLLAFAAGAIVGMQVSGPLVDRRGSRKIMIPAVLADGALLILPRVRRQPGGPGRLPARVRRGPRHPERGDERQRRRGAAGVAAADHVVVPRGLQHRRFPGSRDRRPVRLRRSRRGGRPS
jgi:hypothetical protein